MSEREQIRESWGPPRSRTVVWHDPVAAAAIGLKMAGRDYLEAILAGQLPPAPIVELFNMRGVRVDDGEVEFSCEPDESAYNPIGLIHGGLTCTLLDSVTGCAVHTLLPAGVAYTSIEIKVTYLRPVFAHSGPLSAIGTVTKPGRRVSFAEGSVRGADGKLLATATSSFLILPPETEG
ncbi:MAG: PaaI family thioesterase [Frankia sp.]